jgi:hypothetical protein
MSAPAFHQPHHHLERVQAIDPGAVYVPAGAGGSGDYIQLSGRYSGATLPNPGRVEEFLRHPPEPEYPRPVPERGGVPDHIRAGWRQALGVPCRDCEAAG